MHLDFERHIIEIQAQIDKLLDLADRRGIDVTEEVESLRARLQELKQQTYDNLDPMEQVLVARHPRRPYTLDYVERICANWLELHGDRGFRDDEALVAGWARLKGRSVMLIGHQKGRDMKENLRRNFGMPHPEGYRKALRLMRQAEKFGRPVVTFIDTPGAYPGIGSEERGIGEAIAFNLREMARLRVPIVSVVIGEGMSGGALGIGVTDRILMLEHSIYSVISPEGCAAILWRSAEHREDAARPASDGEGPPAHGDLRPGDPRAAGRCARRLGRSGGLPGRRSRQDARRALPASRRALARGALGKVRRHRRVARGVACWLALASLRFASRERARSTSPTRDSSSCQAATSSWKPSAAPISARCRPSAPSPSASAPPRGAARRPRRHTRCCVSLAATR